MISDDGQYNIDTIESFIKFEHNNTLAVLGHLDWAYHLFILLVYSD